MATATTKRRKKTPANKTSRTAIRRFDLLKHLRPVETRTSSVTTGWKVEWNIGEIVRDLWQNVFDANRGCLDEIEVKVNGQLTHVFGPATMDLDAAFFLGSNKSADDADIGQFGEGLKVASLCLLRDFDAGIVMASGGMAVRIKIADEANAQGLKPLDYHYYRLPKDREIDGTLLVIENSSEALQESFANAPSHFWSADHPQLGPWIAGEMESIYVCETNDGQPGGIFYRRLKRADLDIPIIIAVDRPYKTIDKMTARDRDRNVFGPDLIETFLRLVCKSGTIREGNAYRRILQLCEDHWESGHPLLRHLLNGKQLRGLTIFGEDTYFAKMGRNRYLNFDQQVAVRDIESMWDQAGRKPLPSYFNNAGVPTALDEFENRQRDIREEDPCAAAWTNDGGNGEHRIA